MESEELYHAYKPLLFSLAYRMLGSVMDSEDIVHDVFVDWARIQNSEYSESREIKQAKAYLCKMVTNRCIDFLRSARYRREQYVGEWLPEPIVGAVGTSDNHASATLEGSDPMEQAILRDSMSVAYLIMLEKLSPTERAVFLLRDIFAYDFEEIAEMVDKKTDNCRQMLSRAKKKLSSFDQSSINPSRSHMKDTSVNKDILAQFMRFVTEGNVMGLMNLMVDQTVFTSDGGGKVKAAVHPILGRERVVQFVLGIASKMTPSDFTIELAEVNGEPGIVIFYGDAAYSTMAFSYKDGKITAIYNVMNPDKLQHVLRDE